LFHHHFLFCDEVGRHFYSHSSVLEQNLWITQSSAQCGEKMSFNFFR
jgi:hypothetical protein